MDNPGIRTKNCLKIWSQQKSADPGV